jgi:hypothetical protein
MPKVEYVHPFWRRLIFPIFDLYDLAVTTTLMAIAATFLLVRGKHDILPIAMLVGYAGIVVFLNETSPAVLRGAASDQDKVLLLLSSSGYTENKGRWEPTFRKYTRSPNDHVRLSIIDAVLEIRGPFDVLMGIQEQLAANTG